MSLLDRLVMNELWGRKYGVLSEGKTPGAIWFTLMPVSCRYEPRWKLCILDEALEPAYANWPITMLVNKILVGSAHDTHHWRFPS